MKVKDTGFWKVNPAWSAVIVFSKFFSYESSKLVFEPLALDNSVFDALVSNDSEFETVDLEGR